MVLRPREVETNVSRVRGFTLAKGLRSKRQSSNHLCGQITLLNSLDKTKYSFTYSHVNRNMAIIERLF